MREKARFQYWSDLLDTTEAVRCDAAEDPSPYKLSAWSTDDDGSPRCSGGRNHLEFTDDEWSHYVVVYEGPANLHREIVQRKRTKKANTTTTNKGANVRAPLSFVLVDNMYAACPGSFRIEGGAGIVLSVPNYTNGNRFSSNVPLFTLGGPVEVDYSDVDTRTSTVTVGRLPYIDGCSDTLLIAPVLKGAPCLNHLHFPSLTIQTLHTHPSGRVGIVLRGRGHCVSFAGDNDDEKTVTALIAGSVFHIPTDVVHAFETDDTESMDVIAFHPDSDFGPTPTDHPMINRTYVDGVAAAEIDGLHT